MHRAHRAGIVMMVLAPSGLACSKPAAYSEPPQQTYTVSKVALTAEGVTDTVKAAAVTVAFFPATKARALLGRVLASTDYGPPSQQVVVISYDLWARRFKSAPTIIGNRVQIDGRDAIVVGIVPRDFAVPNGTAVWTVGSLK